MAKAMRIGGKEEQLSRIYGYLLCEARNDGCGAMGLEPVSWGKAERKLSRLTVAQLKDVADALLNRFCGGPLPKDIASMSANDLARELQA